MADITEKQSIHARSTWSWATQTNTHTITLLSSSTKGTQNKDHILPLTLPPSLPLITYPAEDPWPSNPLGWASVCSGTDGRRWGTWRWGPPSERQHAPARRPDARRLSRKQQWLHIYKNQMLWMKEISITSIRIERKQKPQLNVGLGNRLYKRNISFSEIMVKL